MTRLKALSTFLLAALAATTVPLEGCSGCPDIEIAPEYAIVEDPTNTLTSGAVRVTADAIVVAYQTADGARWEAEYRRVEE